MDRYERIMSTWEKTDLMKSTPKQLQAITMVMFASALIPGGNSLELFESDVLSIPEGVFVMRYEMIPKSLRCDETVLDCSVI